MESFSEDLPYSSISISISAPFKYFRPMILVTGGTGIVGAHLLYFLIKENQPVRAIHRRGSDIASIKKVFKHYTPNVDSIFARIEWFEADITDIPALTSAFEGVGYVYHCAALISFDPSDYKVLKKINTEGTANIVNLCLAQKVKKLCYVSSVATFGNALEGKFIDEKTWWNPDSKNNVYAITKYGAEMEVWRGTQEGLDAVIVNPGIIFGISPHNEGSGSIIKIASRDTPFYPSGGMGIVDVKDVVRAMKGLMEAPIKNEQFILVGHNISYKEILDRVALLLNNQPPTKKLSKRLMLLFSALDWFSSKLFGTKRRLVKTTVNSMFLESRYDATKIKKALNFEFTPWEDTIKEMIDLDKK